MSIRSRRLCKAGVVNVGDCDGFGDDLPVEAIAFANPKSSTLTVPSSRTLILAGFKSRWMIAWSSQAANISGALEAVDVLDIRVIERGERLRLAVESGKAFGL